MFWDRFSKKDSFARQEYPAAWRPVLGASMEELRRLAGTTENEFLQIGERMQGICIKSGEISSQADHLVDVAAGQRMGELLERLRQMIADMEEYLTRGRKRSAETFSTLHRFQELLVRISKPLEGFQKMDMTLHILGVAIKIESARLGELGSGFVNLAMDVEKLSRQISEKSEEILKHRELLSSTISESMNVVKSIESGHDAEVSSALAGTAAHLHELESVNDRFTRLGERIAAVSGEIGGNIAEVVSSMQFHDINRQQLEHVVEALEGLAADIDAAEGEGALDAEQRRSLIIETGNVCELQEAQLHFASAEFHAAVSAIVDNLRDVGRRQRDLAEETSSSMGTMDSADSSILDGISRGMSTVTSLLSVFTESDRQMSAAMKQVADTIGEITVFVSDIETIGYATVHIALNAQIKAAHTGVEGSALEVLAKEIKQLSDETVRQTDAIAGALGEINATTDRLSLKADEAESFLGAKISGMGKEVAEIVEMIGAMNAELVSVLTRMHPLVDALTEEVETVTAGIDVHERNKAIADEASSALHVIVEESRRLEPASEEFKENLRLMEQRYTMESERRIHEIIAGRRAGGKAETANEPIKESSTVGGDSEFGDNVDLF